MSRIGRPREGTHTADKALNTISGKSARLPKRINPRSEGWMKAFGFMFASDGEIPLHLIREMVRFETELWRRTEENKGASYLIRAIKHNGIWRRVNPWHFISWNRNDKVTA